MSIYGDISPYTSTILFESVEAINEAYFGKSETLLEVEKQFGLIRKNALKNKISDINKSDEVLKLNRLIEKQFGMDVFALHVDRSNVLNACTIPIAIRFDVAFYDNLKKKIVGDENKGFYFKAGNNLCIVCEMNYGLLTCPTITDAELVAVLLHEIGHNFADAFYHDIELANYKSAKGYFNFLVMYAIFYGILSFGALIPFYIGKINQNMNSKIIKKEKKTRKRLFTGLISTLKSTYSDFTQTVHGISYRLFFTDKRKRGVEKTKEKLDQQGYPDKMRKYHGRVNEVIADKFCGMYGYGPEQVSALSKMEKVPSKAKEFVDKIPVIGKARNMNYEEAYIDINRYDVHPQLIQRLNTEINLLNTELKKADIDPKFINMIKEQIRELEEMRDKLTKVTDEMDKSEEMQIAYNKYVSDTEPNPIDDKIEEKLHEEFDKILANGDKKKIKQISQMV